MKKRKFDITPPQVQLNAEPLTNLFTFTKPAQRCPGCRLMDFKTYIAENQTAMVLLTLALLTLFLSYRLLRCRFPRRRFVPTICWS